MNVLRSCRIPRRKKIRNERITEVMNIQQRIIDDTEKRQSAWYNHVGGEITKDGNDVDATRKKQERVAKKTSVMIETTGGEIWIYSSKYNSSIFTAIKTNFLNVYM